MGVVRGKKLDRNLLCFDNTIPFHFQIYFINSFHLDFSVWFSTDHISSITILLTLVIITAMITTRTVIIIFLK